MKQHAVVITAKFKLLNLVFFSADVINKPSLTHH